MGSRQGRKTGISNISVDEAMTVLAERADPNKKFTNELIDRECKFAPQDSYCRTRVVTDALQYVRELEIATRSSLLALKDFLEWAGDRGGAQGHPLFVRIADCVS